MTDLSIITPLAPDRAAFLPVLGASIATQVGVDAEWILAIDGTGSVEVPAGARCVRLDSRQGPAAARNAAVAVAQGEYLRFIDADDALHYPGALSADLTEARVYGAVVSAAVSMDHNGRITGDEPMHWGDQLVEQGAVADVWAAIGMWKQRNIPLTISVERFHQAGTIPDYPRLSDWAFLMRVNEDGPFVHRTDRTTRYRHHSDQMTASNIGVRVSDWAQVVQAVIAARTTR